MLEKLKARFLSKPYDVYNEKVVKSGSDGYYIYNRTIYYGNRWFVFIVSCMNKPDKKNQT
jgi:hypothetical protein